MITSIKSVKAPEIFQLQEYDAKADLWSVGCIYYEMLVGMPPYRGSSPADLFNNIRTKPLHIPPEVSVSQESLIVLKKVSRKKRKSSR